MPRVALFATCIVDQFFPEVARATLKILRRAGCDVDFPMAQTCCGQPFFNMGYRAAARPLARRTIETLKPYDAVVLPSGSCTTMIRVFYPQLLKDDPRWLHEAEAVARKTYELTEYIVKVLKRPDLGGRFDGKVTYHDCCHLLRELRVKEEPRALLKAKPGCALVEMEHAEECCGFGGTFAVKFGPISGGILDEKLACIAKCGAPVVCASDSSCLMHIAGGMSRQGTPVKTMHVAEVLAAGL